MGAQGVLGTRESQEGSRGNSKDETYELGSGGVIKALCVLKSVWELPMGIGAVLPAFPSIYLPIISTYYLPTYNLPTSYLRIISAYHLSTYPRTHPPIFPAHPSSMHMSIAGAMWSDLCLRQWDDLMMGTEVTVGIVGAGGDKNPQRQPWSCQQC